MKKTLCVMLVSICGCASMNVPEIGPLSYGIGEYQRSKNRNLAAGQEPSGGGLVKLIAVLGDTCLYGLAASYVSDKLNKNDKESNSPMFPNSVQGNGNTFIYSGNDTRLDQSENNGNSR